VRDTPLPFRPHPSNVPRRFCGLVILNVGRCAEGLFFEGSLKIGSSSNEQNSELFQYNRPAQPGLCTFEHEVLTVIVDTHSRSREIGQRRAVIAKGYSFMVTVPPQTRTAFRFLAAQYYTGEMSKHLETLYQNLLNGQLPHNLSWNEAVALVENLGEVQPHGDDEFVFRVGSQRVFFRRPHTHDLGVEEVSRLRKFLKEAGTGAPIEESAKPPRIIVVIDHHAAQVYQDFGGTRPVDEHNVRPYDPFNFHHHLIHRKEAHYRGERVPEEDSFYEEIAKDLTPANEIVLIGHATGKSNAADFLKEYLKTHHPDISRRVIATESADLSAVTEPEVEALAKRHMVAVV
jgi:hypothetical protein